MKFDFTLDMEEFLSLDLLQLLPEKFHNSEILTELVTELSHLTSSWLIDIRGLILLQDPNHLNDASYLRHLGSLTGVQFIDADDNDTSKLRKQIIQAVDWYKLKGTYDSIKVVSNILKYYNDPDYAYVKDMYFTGEYASFVEADWFYGDEDENPDGLGATYYKSPHFGYRVPLIVEYDQDQELESGSATYPYLWNNTEYEAFLKYVDLIRPINTVPHFAIVALPSVDDSEIFVTDNSLSAPGGDVTLSNGGYAARRLIDYTTNPKLYFDESHTGGRTVLFDDNDYVFDQLDTGFINDVTSWVLGDGNKYLTQTERALRLLEEDFDIENVTASGSFSAVGTSARALEIVVTGNIVTFIIELDDGVAYDNISECGLYIGSELVLAALFPDIDKGALIKLVVEFSLIMA